MKITLSQLLFIILMTGITYSKPTSAQKILDKRVSLSVRDESLGNVLKLLNKNHHIEFVYNQELVKTSDKITASFNDEPLKEVLNRLSVQYNVTYQVFKTKIILMDAGNNLSNTDRVFAIDVSGKVVDESNQPVPGVSVVIKGTNKGTVTDGKGDFKLNAGNGDILVFRFVGFVTQEISVKGTAPIVVKLLADNKTLNDVVVMGYGTQKKETLTGAVSIVSLDKLGSRSLNSVGEALAGKSPGVIVTNEGGDPTATPRINVRGVGGVNGESVLYVIDGSIFSGTPQLNPNDIESISVLKDGASAIYGARASGGVVLITTKKGKNGKMQISFDAKIGQQSAWRKPETLNAVQRAEVAATAAKNGSSTLLPAFDASKYPEGQITRTNWMDEVFRTGLLQDYNAAINGGNEKSNFYLSFNYRDAEGIVLNTKTKRYNFRINSEHELTPWLKVGENLAYSHTNGNGVNTTSSYDGVLLSAIYYPTNGTPYNADGSFAGLPGPYPGDYGDIFNPVAELQRLDINNPINVLVINPYATVNLAKGLTFRSNLSITKTSEQYKKFDPKRPEIGRPRLSNELIERSIETNDFLAEQVLSYKASFNDHNLDFTGGYSFQKTKRNGLYASGAGFDDEAPQYRYLTNATIVQPSISDYLETSLLSTFVRANYNYKSKYLLSLIGRRDGTSLLPKNNKFRNYGSISAGWAVNKEDFLQSASWLKELKLRGSYGILGNLATLKPLDVNPLLVATQTAFGQSPVNQIGYIQTALANKEIVWAESKQTNIGIDVNVFNRLSLVADYFVKETNKMILTIPLPGTSGLETQTINAGKARDRGFELGLTYNSDKSKEFNYSVNATFTKVNNKLIKLVDGLETLPIRTNFRGDLAPLLHKVGQPLYSYYVFKTDGIFQSNAEADSYKNASGQKLQPKAKAGDFKFADLNGDGAINSDDRYFAGSAYPNFSYGLSFNANYKNFDFNIFVQGVQGSELFNGVKSTTYNASGPSYNKLAGILDAWSPQNPRGQVPIISTSDANGNFRASDFYIEDGSYLRIRNVTFGYSLPQALTSKLRVGAVRVYATANNLFTITDYSGFDPEIGLLTNGLDSGRYPQARSFMFGLSVNL